MPSTKDWPRKTWSGSRPRPGASTTPGINRTHSGLPSCLDRGSSVGDRATHEGAEVEAASSGGHLPARGASERPLRLRTERRSTPMRDLRA